MARILPSLIALAIAFAIGGALVAATGGSPALAFRALFEGAFGSAQGWSEVGVKTCPLLLLGIAVAIPFRAGIWNIGAEGQLLAGAVAMAWVGSRPPAAPGWIAMTIGLLAAAAAGGAWVALAAFLRIRRSVSEVISTIMLNFIALGLVSYLVHGPLMESAGAYPQTDAVDAAMRLPRLFGTYRVHAGLLIGLAAAAAAWVLLFRSVFGYQIRAVGLNPVAARLAGIPIERSVVAALVLSGALAGVAGAVEVSAVTFRVYEKLSPGWGFTAIAVALLGRLHPGGIVLAALFFGALDAGASSMQSAAGVSSVLVSILQATIIFALLAVERRSRVAAPADDG
jgi:ABC-type uncharacterized transport system permease subunit